MSFAIFSDSSCNLPKAQLEGFRCKSFPPLMSGRKANYLSPYPEDFDGHEYYNFLRNKGVVKNIPDPCRADGGCLPSGSGCG